MRRSRIAGNFQNDVGIGTFEYGVASLGVHTECGAVGAMFSGYALPGHMPSFVDAIKPALAGLPKDASVSDAEIANVSWQAAELVKPSDMLSKATALCSLGGLRQNESLDPRSGESRRR